MTHEHSFVLQQGTTCRCGAYRIPAARATPAEGLDVERLAEAIRNVYIAPSASRDIDAQNIAAEYARLSERRDKEGTE